MLTFKVILLAVSGVIFTRAISPPSRRAPGGSKGDGVYRGQAFEYLVRFLAYLVWVSTADNIFNVMRTLLTWAMSARCAAHHSINTPTRTV